MKKVIVVLIIISSVQLFGQSSKIIDTKIFVNGMCGMCEDRIEEALDIKGIKVADWDVDSKMCRIVYKKEEISEQEIHEILADIGHDTKKVKAKKEVYDNLHHCCHYKREE
ncbi:MAG: heavy-metal-associated domain-containing protein [Parvicellaceae bacterium]